MHLQKLHLLQRLSYCLKSPISIFIVSLLLPLQKITMITDVAVVYLSVLLAIGMSVLLGTVKHSPISASIKQHKSEIAHFNHRHQDFLQQIFLAILLVCNLIIFQFTLHYQLILNLYCSNQHFVLLVTLWILQANLSFIKDYRILYRQIVPPRSASKQL